MLGFLTKGKYTLSESTWHGNFEFQKIVLLPFITFATQKKQKSLLQDSKALKGWLKYQYSLSILYCSMFLVTRSECVTTSFDYFPGCTKKTENQPQNSFFVHVFPPNSQRSNLGLRFNWKSYLFHIYSSFFPLKCWPKIKRLIKSHRLSGIAETCMKMVDLELQ